MPRKQISSLIRDRFVTSSGRFRLIVCPNSRWSLEKDLGREEEDRATIADNMGKVTQNFKSTDL